LFAQRVLHLQKESLEKYFASDGFYYLCTTRVESLGTDELVSIRRQPKEKRAFAIFRVLETKEHGGASN